jgi:hypothetical protein
MPFLKRVRVPEKCPNCKGTYDKFGKKAHECFPARDREELPENRPELHHRDDLKAALSPKRDKEPELPVTTSGTATVGILLPEIEPVRKERPLKRHKAKPESKDSNQPVVPETETRYESPKDVQDMDHTKLWPHAYREEGYRYGSPSSFDSFDDESNP